MANYIEKIKAAGGETYQIRDSEAARQVDLNSTNEKINTVVSNIGDVTLQITTVESEKIILPANNYVSPYKYHASYTIPTEYIEQYGEPISVCARDGSSAPIPAGFGNNIRRFCTVVSHNPDVYIRITYIKLSIPSFDDQE